MSSLRRKHLRTIVLAMILIGLVLILIPFVFSWGISEKAKNNSSFMYDLSDMNPGELRELSYVWVYRRTTTDKESNDRHLSSMVDPESNESRQPLDSKNKWRSANPDFFVFFPHAPVRGCEIEFRKSIDKPYNDWMQSDFIHHYPHFYGRCEGRLWDTSGRLIKRENFPYEKNLIVPKIVWRSHTKMVVNLGG